MELIFLLYKYFCCILYSVSPVLEVKDGTVVHYKQISPKMGMNPLLSFTGRQKLILGEKVVRFKKKKKTSAMLKGVLATQGAGSGSDCCGQAAKGSD